MQVTTEQIDPCKLALTITVEPEKVEAAKEKAFRQFAQNVQVPGFRKGKVPTQMARAYVDPNRVKQRAAEALVESVYPEAVEQTKIEPFAQPELEMVEMEDEGPFVFKALVPLRPVVTLGLYKGLALERRRLQVADSDVDKQLDEVLSRQAEYPEVSDRNVQTADILLAGLTAQVEGHELPDLAEPRDTVIEVGKNIPDFDNALVGMAVGETKTIDALYPEEFADEEMRGKRATFTVSVKEIRSKVLPELNDELVQKIHPTAKTPDELKTALHESLEKAADEMADNELEFRLIGEIVKTSQIFFPEVLLRAEMQADAEQINERLQRDKITIEQYLDEVGKDREGLEKEIAANADVRIRNSLVLSEVAKADAITVDDSDVDAIFTERAERANVSPAAVRAFAEKNDQMTQIRDQALTRKILNHLKSLSAITDKFVTAEELETLSEASAEAGAESVQDAAPAEAVTAEVEAKPKKKRASKKAEAATEETPETDDVVEPAAE